MSAEPKRLVNFRLTSECIDKLDYIANQLTELIKVNFDRTMAIEYCIRWEYDRQNNTNKTQEFIENLTI